MDSGEADIHLEEQKAAKQPQHQETNQFDVPRDPKESGISESNSASLVASIDRTMTASQTSLVHVTTTSEPPMKRLKLDGSFSQASLSKQSLSCLSSGDSEEKEKAAVAAAPPSAVSVDSSEVASSEAAEETPLKSTTYQHLQNKYLHELEYMLREFQKLERQLLGAKSAQSSESAGSKERREKLHSFILHLQDTVNQIQSGCKLQAEGKPTVSAPLESTALSKLTREKEEEENVQKLEEHILANLLPVKVRLKKQLAAQQGARHNPAGMPVRGVVQAESKGKGTFMQAAEKKSSQFGQPLEGGGSSLTQKLHGRKLGSSSRLHGHGVGQSTESSESEKPKLLCAGMAPGSDQLQSSISAASSVHRLMIHDPVLLEISAQTSLEQKVEAVVESVHEPPSMELPAVAATSEDAADFALPPAHATLTDDERALLRKRRKKKKRKALIDQSIILQTNAEAQKPKRKKGNLGKKRGPRSVEYMCALCNEVYSSTCDYNPWWALSQHECPKCHKTQIPRVDISAPANAIEYHPALLAHVDDGAGSAGGASTIHVAPVEPPSPKAGSDSDSLGSDLSDDDLLSDIDSLESDDSDSDVFTALTPAEQAENEKFGEEYDGPKLSADHASRLLILMLHASTCPCQHNSLKHRDTCRSTKWMMLHVRDCPGTTSSFDVCPFPWCRKVKHLLYHLVSCVEPETCEICSPATLQPNWAVLRGLSEHRIVKHRENMISRAKATAESRTKSLVGSSAITHSRPKSQDQSKAILMNEPIQPSLGACTIPSLTSNVQVTAPDSAVKTRVTFDSSSKAQAVGVALASVSSGVAADLPHPGAFDFDGPSIYQSPTEEIVTDQCLTAGQIAMHTINSAKGEPPQAVIPERNDTDAAPRTDALTINASTVAETRYSNLPVSSVPTVSAEAVSSQAMENKVGVETSEPSLQQSQPACIKVEQSDDPLHDRLYDVEAVIGDSGEGLEAETEELLLDCTLNMDSESIPNDTMESIVAAAASIEECYEQEHSMEIEAGTNETSASVSAAPNKSQEQILFMACEAAVVKTEVDPSSMVEEVSPCRPEIVSSTGSASGVSQEATKEPLRVQ